MNILSIDWDYFVDCTQEEINALFPVDGNEGIGMQLSSDVWFFSYAETMESSNSENIRSLIDLEINYANFEYLKTIISRIYVPSKPLLITDSHEDLYAFVKRIATVDDVVNLVNVDHHHDMYGLREGVDCGNWGNHLDIEGYLDKFTWIHNDSFKYELTRDDVLKCDYNQTTDLKYLETIDMWDAIFICRSSLWIPPHLDKHFNELYELFTRLGAKLDKSFFINRFDDIKRDLEYME